MKPRRVFALAVTSTMLFLVGPPAHGENAADRADDSADRTDGTDQGGENATGALQGKGGEERLSSQTVVYYNARTALREKRYEDVLKLWLLHNALEDQGQDPVAEGDFRSAVWAAVAAAGLCHDGLRADDDGEGVGLWPLAMHNWLTRSTSKQPAPPQPRTFTSFQHGFQQRLFSLHDVLSAEEMRGIRFVRRDCTRPYIALAWLGTPHWLDLDDRLSVGIMMRDLLELSQESLEHDRVRGQVVLETRLFDLEVALGKLAKSKARRETGLLAQLAKVTGVSEAAMSRFREKRYEALRKSQYTSLLRRCLTWNTLDWFSLSQNRRLALFTESVETYGAQQDMQEGLQFTILQNIDYLLDKKDGNELNQWLGFAARRPAPDPDGGPPDLASREALIDAIALSDRGEKFLALEPATGFRQRSVIALRRGTDSLQRGLPLDAMRSFALAMNLSHEARAGDKVHNLAKRWFAYVLAQHEASDEVMAILREFVAPIDRNELLEILLWRAAFHADAESFERIAGDIRKGGSLDFRVRMLRPLSQGNAGALWQQTRVEFKERPRALYKFVQKLVDELSTEPLDIRLKNKTTLQMGLRRLGEASQGASKGIKRRMVEQEQRIQTLLDGFAQFDETPTGRARAAAPGPEAYAGSVRLAPVDPLPWPFPVPRVTPPSPFSPIELTPVEWLDSAGEIVFGWHIHEK